LDFINQYFVHPENPFISNYNFDLLCKAFPPLENFVFENKFGTQTIKFADSDAVRALNIALLKNQYNIDWDIPKHNLCPPIPGRLDYLLYANDLIQKSDIHILDIGTGANLIYPILAKCHFGWKCTASEVDMDSIKHAKKIMEINSSLRNIDIKHQKSKDRIFETIVQPNHEFDMVVCNPPFYKNQKDADENNLRKVKNLKLSVKNKHNFGGQSNELWYKGGEEAFIIKMIQESTHFKEQVHWFTTLVSKKESLKNIKRVLAKVNPNIIKIVEMGQGNKKSRFVAWTYR